MRRIECVPQGQAWAIKHNGGYLGYATTEQEGRRVIDALSHDLIISAAGARAVSYFGPGRRPRLIAVNGTHRLRGHR